MARVRVSARAEESLERHDDWLRARDPQAADRFLGEVERLAALLAEHPFAGARVEGRPLRFVVTRRYRYKLVYRVVGDTVEIVEVLHPRQSGP